MAEFAVQLCSRSQHTIAQHELDGGSQIARVTKRALQHHGRRHRAATILSAAQEAVSAVRYPRLCASVLLLLVLSHTSLGSAPGEEFWDDRFDALGIDGEVWAIAVWGK